MNRDIEFGYLIDLRPKIARGMGVREAVLVGGAVLQALWLIFVYDVMPFPLRATLALFIAIVLLAIAVVPFGGMRFEIWVATYLRYLLRPKQRVHMTAERDRPAFVDEEASENADDVDQTERTRDRPFGASPWWVAPDPQVVMAAFVCLLVAGSVIAYLGKGGTWPMP
ncbi:MAG: PrgI family protein [Anaerolineae bacterium]|nr:PrgI family protein [Anaerolineae bacterium]